MKSMIKKIACISIFLAQSFYVHAAAERRSGYEGDVPAARVTSVVMPGVGASHKEEESERKREEGCPRVVHKFETLNGPDYTAYFTCLDRGGEPTPDVFYQVDFFEEDKKQGCLGISMFRSTLAVMIIRESEGAGNFHDCLKYFFANALSDNIKRVTIDPNVVSGPLFELLESISYINNRGENLWGYKSVDEHSKRTFGMNPIPWRPLIESFPYDSSIKRDVSYSAGGIQDVRLVGTLLGKDEIREPVVAGTGEKNLVKRFVGLKF